jgi:hypothetical protein
MRKPNDNTPPEIIDEAGMADGFQRGLRRALNTSPTHRSATTPTGEERPASNRHVHKGKLRG